MAIPAINVLGNPNVTEGNFQIAIEDLRKSVIGSGKAYDSANTYSQYDTCVSGGIVYYSKINSNTGNTPAVNENWGLIGDLITGIVHNVGNESINGIKTFTTSPVVPTPATTGNVITMGNILEKTPVGIGYGPGAGGTVTQLTSKSTAVTLNKPTGQIVMNNAALAAGASVEFTLNNTSIITYSIVTVNPVWSNSNYKTEILLNTTGAVIIKVTNMSGSSLSDSLVVRFNVISGAVS